MRPSDQKLTLQVLQQSERAIRVTPFKEGSLLESTIKTSRTCPFHSALVADRAGEILGILARANAGRSGLLDELVAAGQAIWVDLLPDFLKQKLAEAVGRNLVLHLDRPLLGIPWELLHDGDDFLGRRFRIGRLVTVEGAHESAPLQRTMKPPLSALVVADPSGDLPAAREEAQQVAAILEDAPAIGAVTVLAGHVTTRALRDALSRHDVLHYAGHAEAYDRPHLRLADGPFTDELLWQLRGRIDFPGLVFLNGCGSAGDAVSLAAGHDPVSNVSGLAAAFLLSGTRHVVGTLWDVRDEVARLFATSFYDELGRGGTIGRAMERAREAIIERHGLDSLLWAHHLLYGDPTWSIEPEPNLLDDDFDVLDGLERKYRGELASAQPGRRLLAAAMLLRLGERAAIDAIAADLTELERWLGGGASEQERRHAALVVGALAGAAGREPGAASPDEVALPDVETVRALVRRVAQGP